MAKLLRCDVISFQMQPLKDTAPVLGHRFQFSVVHLQAVITSNVKDMTVVFCTAIF